MNISGPLSKLMQGLGIGEIPIKSFIGLPINDAKGKKIGAIMSVDIDNDLWYGTVEYDIFKEPNEVSMETDRATKQKEDLIKQVKMLGQEVVDRAEDIVGANDVRTSLEIILRFEYDCVPEIECTSTYMSKRFIYGITDIPLTAVQSGISLNAIRESFGLEPIENNKREEQNEH